jgi:hypothetical protein
MFVACHAMYACRKEDEERLIIWRKHIHCLPSRKFSDSYLIAHGQFDWNELPTVSGVSALGIMMGLAREGGMIIMLSKRVAETYF